MMTPFSRFRIKTKTGRKDAGLAKAGPENNSYKNRLKAKCRGPHNTLKVLKCVSYKNKN
jgi:hypothetical protein